MRRKRLGHSVLALTSVTAAFLVSEGSFFSRRAQLHFCPPHSCGMKRGYWCLQVVVHPDSHPVSMESHPVSMESHPLPLDPDVAPQPSEDGPSSSKPTSLSAALNPHTDLCCSHKPHCWLLFCVLFAPKLHPFAVLNFSKSIGCKIADATACQEVSLTQLLHLQREQRCTARKGTVTVCPGGSPARTCPPRQAAAPCLTPRTGRPSSSGASHGERERLLLRAVDEVEVRPMSGLPCMWHGLSVCCMADSS